MADDDFQSLNTAEVEQAMKAGDTLKHKLVDAVNAGMAATLEQDIADHVFRCAATTECLLLAAHMYAGDARSFLIMAGKSYATAQENHRIMMQRNGAEADPSAD